MPRTPSRRKPPAAAKPDVSVSVQGNVDGELYVAGGDISVTQYSREDRLLIRARVTLLDKVEQFWIEGVLEKSLHGAAILDLGLKASEDEVGHPWETVVESMDAKKTQAVPSNQSILDVFDAQGRALLILGHPGSGKTITLLELARDLVKAVREDDQQPVPVVFNLSSWHGGPISQWLVNELSEKYGVPSATGRLWVDADELALLLDGLDEVRADQREACVEALNKFRVSHGLAPMAVTCRKVEYDAIGKQLSLNGAVTLQPLSEKQVDAYLKRTGEEFASLRKAVKDDPALRELAQTPLMLTVMMLAYRGVEIKDLPGGNTVSARRKHLFDEYVARMLKRRPANASASEGDTLQYLQWIARRMIEDNQSIFMLEGIQPRWLPSRFSRRAYNAIERFVGVPLLALLALAITLIVMMVIQGVFLGNTPDVVLNNWGVTLFIGSLFFGASIGAIAGRSSRYDIRAVEALRWSWGWSWRQARLGVLIGLGVSLILSIITFFFLGYFKDAISRGGVVMLYTMGRHLTFWWLFGLGDAICWGILFGLLFGGLRPAEIETTLPNQGMRFSFRNGQTVGLGVLLGLGALLVPMVTGLQYFVYREPFEVSLSGGSITGMAVAGLASFVMGLFYGALPVIQHITVRALLAFSHAIPLRLERFFDLTSELIFTRKVGGGYIFVHRLLMEHMAGVETEEPAAKGVARLASTLDGTAYWFVPEKARRQIDFRRVERVARRASLIAIGIVGAVLLILMFAANLTPNLFAIGDGAELGGVGATGYVSEGLGWSPNDAQVATVHETDAGGVEVDVWNAATGARIQKPYPGGFAFGGDYASPDGRYWLALKVVSGSSFRGYKADLWVWDLTTGQVIQTLPVGLVNPSDPVAWSPDSKQVAVGHVDKITIWDALKGKQVVSIPGDGSVPYDMVWTPDGSAISSRSAEGLVTTYRASNGEKLAQFSGGTGVGAYSPDGTLVALDDQTSDIGYFIYDVKTGDKVGAFSSDVAILGQMVNLSWSPDGTQIAAAQNTLTGSLLMSIRDAVTGAEIRSMPLKTLDVAAFSWSPDGSRITLGQPNGALAILDTATGETVSEAMWAPTNWVTNLPFWSPDGKQLAALGVDDRSVVVKTVEP